MASKETSPEGGQSSGGAQSDASQQSDISAIMATLQTFQAALQSLEQRFQDQQRAPTNSTTSVGESTALISSESAAPPSMASETPSDGTSQIDLTAADPSSTELRERIFRLEVDTWPRYSGADAEDPVAFVAELREELRGLRVVNDKRRKAYLRGSLSGSALLHVTPLLPLQNFDAICAALVSYFDSPEARFGALIRLITARQGSDESVQTFAYRQMNIARRVAASYPDRVVLELVRQQLREPLARRLRNVQCNTISDLIAVETMPLMELPRSVAPSTQIDNAASPALPSNDTAAPGGAATASTMKPGNWRQGNGRPAGK